MVLWNPSDLAHVLRVSRATGPGVAPARDSAPRFLISGLAVIRDQMGTSSARVRSRSSFDHTLRGDADGLHGGL